MNDETVGGVHWSFWAIGALFLWYSRWAESKGWVR